MNIRLRALVALSSLPVVACAADAGTDPGRETVGSQTEPICGPFAQPAIGWQRARAAFVITPGVGVCSGTLIAPRFVLTAAHCQPSTSTVVEFFTGSNSVDSSTAANVLNVNVAPGVNKYDLDYDWFSDPDDLTDANGKFADMAILQIDRDVPTSTVATLAWSYPGANQTGIQVGEGAACGDRTKIGQLFQTSNVTDSADDSGGGFHTQHDFVNGGDSGGPFYFGGRVLGDLFGFDLDGNVNHDFYTSVPFRLPWILGVIGYKWAGNQTIFGKQLTGTVFESFPAATESVCQYACEQHVECRGYNFTPSTCTTFTAISGVVPAPGVQYALRFGKPSSRTGNPVGYDRAPYPGYSSVVKRGAVGDVHEIYLGPGMPAWATGDLSAISGAPTMTGRASVYVRSDGVNAVLFRSAFDGNIQEISLTSGWSARDLTAYSGYTPSGDPAAYVRSDGNSAFVYRTGSVAAGTSQLIEMSAPGGGPTSWPWNLLHLTSVPGAQVPAGDPSAHVRSDGVSSVVYRGIDGHVVELFSSDGKTWGVGDPWSIAWSSNPSPPVVAAGNPFGFTDHNGMNAIVYRGTDGHIYELFLDGGTTWRVGDLTGITAPTPLAAGDPFAYVRAEGVTAVVFRSTSNEIIELAETTQWLQSGDLTAWGPDGDPSVPWYGVAAGDPTAYVRADGTNSVLFRDASNHARELTMTGRGWQGWDLTNASGEKP